MELGSLPSNIKRMDLMDWNRMLPVKTQIQVQNFGDQIDTTNIRIKHDATAPGNATTNIAKIDPETRSSQGEKSKARLMASVGYHSRWWFHQTLSLRIPKMAAKCGSNSKKIWIYRYMPVRIEPGDGLMKFPSHKKTTTKLGVRTLHQVADFSFLDGQPLWKVIGVPKRKSKSCSHQFHVAKSSKFQWKNLRLWWSSKVPSFWKSQLSQPQTGPHFRAPWGSKSQQTRPQSQQQPIHRWVGLSWGGISVGIPVSK